jgi:hypothetical protein
VVITLLPSKHLKLKKTASGKTEHDVHFKNLLNFMRSVENNMRYTFRIEEGIWQNTAFEVQSFARILDKERDRNKAVSLLRLCPHPRAISMQQKEDSDAEQI